MLYRGADGRPHPFHLFRQVPSLPSAHASARRGPALPRASPSSPRDPASRGGIRRGRHERTTEGGWARRESHDEVAGGSAGIRLIKMGQTVGTFHRPLDGERHRHMEEEQQAAGRECACMHYASDR